MWFKGWLVIIRDRLVTIYVCPKLTKTLMTPLDVVVALTQAHILMR